MKLLSKLFTVRHEVDVNAKGITPVLIAAGVLIVFTLVVLYFGRVS